MYQSIILVESHQLSPGKIVPFPALGGLRNNPSLSNPIRLGDCPSRSILEIRGGGVKLLVKSISGKTLSIDLDENASINDLKEKIHNLEGIPPDRQRLVHSGRQLESSASIGSSGLQNSSTIHLVMRLRGGNEDYSRPSLNFSSANGELLDDLKRQSTSFQSNSAPYERSPLQNPLVSLALSFFLSLILSRAMERVAGWFSLSKFIGWLKAGLKWLRGLIFYVFRRR